MESKFFPSSNAGPAKRGLSDELQESPTAKRAKRAKHGKKRRSKEVKGDKDSDGYVEQKDWVSFDDVPATSSPVARKQSPIMPPVFPLKEAHKAHVLKSAEKAKEEQNEARKAKTKKEAKDGAKHSTAPTEANTRKTRAEPEVNGEPKYPINNGIAKIPAVAGPSKPRVHNNKCAYEPRELTPLSDLGPTPDYTFKSYPNPPPLRFPPVIKTSKEPKQSKPAKGAADKVLNGNNTKAPVNGNPSSPSPASPNNSPTTHIETEKKENDKNDEENEPGPAPAPATLELESDPALAAPSGTKTLKAINRHLKALEARLLLTHPNPNPNQNQNQNQNPNQSINQTQTIQAQKEEMSALRADLRRLQEQLDRNELRAAVRHEMLFNALVKVAGEVGALGGEVRDQLPHGLSLGQLDGHGHGHGHRRGHGQGGDGGDGDGDGVDGEGTAVNGVGGGTPRASRAASVAAAREVRDKMSRSMQQSRKTLEQCLRIYTEDMNRAGSREEVAKYGGLVVQYAGDLFKTLG
ncbi:hypothetical protein C8A01DRAFT_19002 [Parachaetomium inaequale]|uniref:Uncharacterized protein n=1 Tax=Parachaetomium inaequale TaxID=2588326 RepID=A0AAN6SNS9_9PEZI|nr:hypothetical protein C8A01DRAFT_19002 [Parachaetomium inaequale]